jgi:hypothetical protein
MLDLTNAHCNPSPPSSLPTTHHYNVTANSIYDMTTKPDLVKYLHQCCFTPTPSAWIKAIQNRHFTTWPGLTVDLARKHLPKSDATIKGHLKQQYKNTWSTSVGPHMPTAQASTESPVMMTDTPIQTNWVFVSAIQATGQIYTDQTRKFPVTSSLGNKYIMLLYDYDSNAIHC